MTIRSEAIRSVASKLKGVVLAGNYKEFVDFCAYNGFDPTTELRYIVSDQQLYGCRGLPIYRTGTWEKTRMALVLKDKETV